MCDLQYLRLYIHRNIIDTAMCKYTQVIHMSKKIIRYLDTESKIYFTSRYFLPWLTFADSMTCSKVFAMKPYPETSRP